MIRKFIAKEKAKGNFMVDIKALSLDTAILAGVAISLLDSTLDRTPMRPIIFSRWPSAPPVGVLRTLHFGSLRFCLAFTRAILAVAESDLAMRDLILLAADSAYPCRYALLGLVCSTARIVTEMFDAIFEATWKLLKLLAAIITDQGYLGAGLVTQPNGVGFVGAPPGAVFAAMRAFAGVESLPADRARFEDGVSLGALLPGSLGGTTI